MLTTTQVAKHLGVTERSVTRYVKRGLLPATQIGERGPYIFEPADIEEFVPGRSYVNWDKRLAAVAMVYEQAKLNGTSHRRAIAEAFDVPIGSGTVDRWLLLARERGYIEGDHDGQI